MSVRMWVDSKRYDLVRLTCHVNVRRAHEDVFGQERWEILAQRARLVKHAVPDLPRMVTAEIEIVQVEHPELVRE